MALYAGASRRLMAVVVAPGAGAPASTIYEDGGPIVGVVTTVGFLPAFALSGVA